MQTKSRFSLPRNRAAYAYPFPLTERGIARSVSRYDSRAAEWAWFNAAEVLTALARYERDPLRRAASYGAARAALRRAVAAREARP